MKNAKTLGLVIAIALGTFGGAAAYAHGDHDQKGGQGAGMMSGQRGMMGGGQGGMMGGGQGGMMGGDQGGMMKMMMRMHKQMMNGGMMGGMGGGHMGPLSYMKGFDADGDGTVSPEEMRAGQAAKLAEFDANGDGVLTIDEFENLHSAAIREKMVDRFQMLDNDGDGKVTAEEMAAPADVMEKMMKRRAAAMGGQKGEGGMGMGSGQMMQDQDN